MNNCGRDTRTRNENLFVAYLYTECANSQTEHEPQGGEPMSAELDEQYKRLRRLLATAWRTKRSDITKERYLSMRVPPSPLANDVLFCRITA